MSNSTVTSICLVISARTEDLLFAEKVALSCGRTPQQATTVVAARAFLAAHPDAVVLWDVDHPGILEKADPLSFQAVAQMLLETTDPERVFAISKEPVSAIPYVFNIPAFGHHLFRKYDDPAAAIIARIAIGCSRSDPSELSHYLAPRADDESAVQKIMIRKSAHRRAAADAIVTLVDKRGIHPRLAALAAQAVDELLMNAIFNAPVSPEGNTYRRLMDRATAFDLSERETVTLEMGVSPGYVVVSVSDQFGSLQKKAALSFIRKDYQRLDYKMRTNEPGAGLGIYGMVQSGLSLLFLTRAGIQTKVVVFVPQLKNFRDFRDSFRFVSFVSR